MLGLYRLYGLSLAAVWGIVTVVASLVSEFTVFSKCHTPLEQCFFSSSARWGSCESADSDSAGPRWTKSLHFRQDPRWCRWCWTFDGQAQQGSAGCFCLNCMLWRLLFDDGKELHCFRLLVLFEHCCEGRFHLQPDFHITEISKRIPHLPSRTYIIEILIFRRSFTY